MTWNGRRIWTQRGRRNALRGLRLAAEHILQVSKTQVPLEEGTLERSGKVTVDESRLEAAVSYDTVYAVRQHEELTWHHPVPGRKAKYLEDPMREEHDRAMEIIAAQVRRWLSRG
jgi:hypothetical protein